MVVYRSDGSASKEASQGNKRECQLLHRVPNINQDLVECVHAD
jgi:hypothetical protein